MDKAFKENIKELKSQVKKRIKELKAQGKYEEIFFEFGKDAYIRYVPAKHRNQDLKKLKKEGRYEDIFNKHGESEYNKILITAMYNEIKEAKGFGAAAAWRTKEFIKSTLQNMGLYSLALSLSISGSMAMLSEMETSENADIYKDEIKAYNDKIENYANEVNRYAFNDVQIFVKVIDDMWNGIKGYANPQKDIHGYLELDLATEDGFGVCRNMASDVARKLNEINPKYNARIMAARMGEDGYYEIADVGRTVIEPNQTVTNSDGQSDHLSNLEKVITNITGNHMITLVDVPEDNLTVVLDPTNPGIGIYLNGKIIMLNSTKENGLDFEAKEYVTAIFSRGGLDGIIGVASDYMKSFQKPKLTFDEIEQKYGLNAQNLAIQEVRERMAMNEAVDVATITSHQSKSDFNEKYKFEPIQPSSYENNVIKNETEQEREFE
ncbi:MAG: hypothetical protein IKL55_00480 [Clostridia bacterium]|nr:hypothetical protein [Clostridia bacterium]